MVGGRDYTEDYYVVLGVPRDASLEDIRRAGRARQREAHPDFGGSTEQFVRVRVAVEVLTDSELRADHDEWLLGRRRGRGTARLRTQRRSRADGGAAPEYAGRRGPANGSGSPGGASRAPGTFVPRAETPPPDRIPPVDTDVRRMAWYRTAWPERATQWPPARAVAPPMTAGELSAVVVHALVLLVATAALALPISFVQLRVPSLVEGESGPALWWLVVAFGGVGAAWLACRVLVRGRLFARIAHIITLAIGAISSVLTGSLALLALIASPEGFANRGFQMLLVQSALYACYAVSGFVAWRALGPRTRTALRDRLLSDLAESSAPPVDDPTRVWGRPGKTAMGTDDVPTAVNPMRAVLAQGVVGEAIGQLQRIPSVRIVHGVRAAGIGTVPHAVIAGRRIALIDAQLWTPGEYGIGPTGMLTRDGGEFPSAAVEFPHIVERFHRLFGETAVVRGWIAIVPERDGGLSVDASRTWQRVRLATVPDALREVGDWLAEDGERVDRLLVRDLLRHRA